MLFKYEANINEGLLALRIHEGEGSDYRVLSFRVTKDDYGVTELNSEKRLVLTKSDERPEEAEYVALDRIRSDVKKLEARISKSDLLYHLLMELMLRVYEVRFGTDAQKEVA